MPDRKVKVILDASIGGFTAKMAAASKSVSETANKMTGASKEAVKMRRGLDELGSTAGKIGLVAAAGVGAAVVAAANFDQAMSRVQAATHESAKTMDALRKAAIIAGRDTVFSATESADAITELAKAGVSAGDILHGGLKGALSLASAGELDVATAAGIAATAMNQFALQGKDVGHIADLLAAGANKAVGEVTDFAGALKFVGPVAHQMGISIDETVGSITELANAGILGEQAGTSLRGMLTALTSPSKQAQKTMEQLGISLYDATGKFVGFRGVAEQLHTTMAGLSAAERDQALGRIFGNEQITAARILYAGGAADVDKWTKAVNDQGYAAQTAATKMDNLRGDLEQLRGSLETALIGAGSGSQSALRGMTQDVTGAVNAFTKLPPAIQSTATNMLAITAITGGGLWFGSKVIKGISDTRTALKNLSVEATTTRTALTGLTRGIEFVAIIEGVNLLDKSLQSLLHENLDTSKLAGDLKTLGETGQVTGTLMDTFGKSLDKFGKYAKQASSLDLSTKIFGWLPGSTTGEIARKNLKALDDTLTQMVASGNGDQASKVFNSLTAAADKQGVSVDKLSKLLPSYSGALVKSSGAANVMQDAMTGLLVPTGRVGDAVGAVGQASSQAAADMEKQAKALDKARDAAGQTARQFVGLGKLFDKPKVSLDAWVADMEKQAKALENLLVNAKKAAKNGVAAGLVQELEQQGPAGALRLQQLGDATEAEVKRANRAWRSQQKAVEDFKDAVAGKTQFEIDTEKAERRLRRLKRLMDSFYSVSITVDAKTGHQQAKHQQKGSLDAQAYATGGYTGAGGKYEPAGIVHRGEYVFSSEATHGNERYLESLHRSLRGYATGGMVGASTPAPGTVSLSMSDADVSRIAGALLAARPIFGDVHLSGDGSFEREQRARRTAALSGGRP